MEKKNVRKGICGKKGLLICVGRQTGIGEKEKWYRWKGSWGLEEHIKEVLI